MVSALLTCACERALLHCCFIQVRVWRLIESLKCPRQHTHAEYRRICRRTMEKGAPNNAAAKPSPGREPRASCGAARQLICIAWRPSPANKRQTYETAAQADADVSRHSGLLNPSNNAVEAVALRRLQGESKFQLMLMMRATLLRETGKQCGLRTNVTSRMMLGAL